MSLSSPARSTPKRRAKATQDNASPKKTPRRAAATPNKEDKDENGSPAKKPTRSRRSSRTPKAEEPEPDFSLAMDNVLSKAVKEVDAMTPTKAKTPASAGRKKAPSTPTTTKTPSRTPRTPRRTPMVPIQEETTPPSPDSVQEAPAPQSCLRLTFVPDECSESILDANKKVGKGRKSVAFQEDREDKDEAVVRKPFRAFALSVDFHIFVLSRASAASTATPCRE